MRNEPYRSSVLRGIQRNQIKSSQMSAFKKLVEHSQKCSRFQHLASICGWDQASMMPAGGNQARSEAMAELSVHIHGLMTPKLDYVDLSIKYDFSESKTKIEKPSLRAIIERNN